MIQSYIKSRRPLVLQALLLFGWVAPLCVEANIVDADDGGRLEVDIES